MYLGGELGISRKKKVFLFQLSIVAKRQGFKNFCDSK